MSSKKVQYDYKFNNGVISISRGVKTKFDWYASVDLTDDIDGSKRGIVLNQRIFLTRKHALNTTIELLKKFSLYE